MAQDNRPTQTAQAQSAPTTNNVTVITQDSVLEFLNERSGIDTTALGTDYHVENPTTLPIIEGTVNFEITDSAGQVHKCSRPRTIQDARTDIKYIYLSPKDLKEHEIFSDPHFIPVTRSNPGGQGVPERYFDKNSGMVMRRDNVLCSVNAEWYEKVKDYTEAPQKARMDSLANKTVMAGPYKDSGVTQELSVTATN